MTLNGEQNSPFGDQIIAGTYRIIRLIGEGGMGAVYEARHTRLPRRFAVKVLFQHVAEHSEAVERFRQEAMICSELGHPHIVDVVDFNFTEDGTPYLVMEHLDGENLEDRLEQEQWLELDAISAILNQTASALDAVHKRGIIHRDLKPQNMFLCQREGEDKDYVKVLDFGISKVSGSSAVHTRAHIVIGTPWYMSPEQAKGQAATLDHRTDVFALGSMTYEMIGGRPPFMGDTPDSVLYQVVHEQPEPLSQLREGITPAIEAVVARAMAKKPDDRYDNLSEMARDFARAIDPFESAIARGLDQIRTEPHGGLAVEEDATIPDIDLSGVILDPDPEDEDTLLQPPRHAVQDAGAGADSVAPEHLPLEDAEPAPPSVVVEGGYIDNSGLVAMPPPAGAQESSGLTSMRQHIGGGAPVAPAAAPQHRPMPPPRGPVADDGLSTVLEEGPPPSMPLPAPGPEARRKTTTLSTYAGEVRRRQSMLPVALGAGTALLILGLVLFMALRGTSVSDSAPPDPITVSAPSAASAKAKPPATAAPPATHKPAPTPRRATPRKAPRSRRRSKALPRTLSLAQLKKGITAAHKDVQACVDRYRVPGLAPVELSIKPNGRVTRARVSGFLAGTPTSKCIEAATRQLQFSAFRGSAVTRTHTFKLTPRATRRYSRLHTDQIKDGMRGAGAWVRKCYQKYKLKGRLSLRVTISTEGTVRKVKLKKPLAGTAAGSCVQRAVKQARFPLFKRGPISVNYTYLPR